VGSSVSSGSTIIGGTLGEAIKSIAYSWGRHSFSCSFVLLAWLFWEVGDDGEFTACNVGKMLVVISLDINPLDSMFGEF